MRLVILFLGAAVTNAAAMPQCQTEESRGLRYASQAMAQAARESDPWAGCGGSMCSMQSSVADSMEATQRRFEAESRAYLYKARASEAAKCPQWADRIMAGIGLADSDQQKSVATAFQNEMQKEYDRLTSLKTWQNAHPQCKHVLWMGGTSFNTHDDFSGHFQDRKNFNKPFDDGWCSADAHGETWHGTDDDLKMSDPDQNDLIGKVVCASALRKFDLFEGSYADPKFCQ